MTTKCAKCGKFYSTTHSSREDDGKCFNCYFWSWHVELRRTTEKLKSVIVDGTAYMLGDEPDRPGWGCGFGGSKFVIEFFDGREVTTHNLWHQGTIPKRFRNELPDNARFKEK